MACLARGLGVSSIDFTQSNSAAVIPTRQQSIYLVHLTMLPIRAIPRLCISSQHESFRLSQHALSAILRTNLPSTMIIEFCITGNRTLVFITNICQQLNKLCLHKPILYLYMPSHHHYHQKSHSIHPSHQPHTPNHKHGNRPH
jgi:hypothetical protein